MVRKIAIIPARGGSKRIPKKNIKSFCGKPMIAWTIEAALNSKIFDRVFVSTDCAEIAKVASQYGVEVPFLRKAYADDFSTVSEVTCYALDQVKEVLDETYDIVAQLMPNCPLRTSEAIFSSMNHFSEMQYKFLLSCFKFGWSNPWWAFSKDNEDRPSPVFSEKNKMRSQDMAELYCPTGAIWIAKVSDLLTQKSFYAKDHRFYEIPWLEAVDIDTVDDFDLAEKLGQVALA